MTTKDDDTRTAKQREDEQRKQSDKQSGERQHSTRGEEVDPRTGRAVGEEYDPMQDPTFNKNEAQRYEEPVASDEAAS